MKTVINFLLYLHINYIQEEWEIIKPFGRIILKPFWFIRSVFIYLLLSPLIFIIYLVEQTKSYKQAKKNIDNSLENKLN